MTEPTLDWHKDFERINRIRISVAAYAYEICDHTIMPDLLYDKLCQQINPEIDTGDFHVDDFFETEFEPFTGKWIHNHPSLHLIKEIYDKAFPEGAPK